MSKQRAPSKTVDLRGFTESELLALVDTAWPMRDMEILPLRALIAMERLQVACDRISRRPGADERRKMRALGLTPKEAERESVSKIPRASLQAFADAIRPQVSQSSRKFPAIQKAMQKLDKRLQTRPGRPAQSTTEWQRRASDVRRTARDIREKMDRPPTDLAVEILLDLKPGTLRNWRRRHRDLFPPFAA